MSLSGSAPSRRTSRGPMPANQNKPHRWKDDIAMSIDAYNQWFLEYAPDAFQQQRSSAAADVCSAMDKTANFRKIDNKVLMEHPGILQALRMATCPPIARDRLVGLAGTGKNLVSRMEKKGTVPPRMSSGQLARRLSRIGTVVRRLIDTDLCPWVAENRDATQEETRRAAIVVADHGASRSTRTTASRRRRCGKRRGCAWTCATSPRNDRPTTAILSIC